MGLPASNPDGYTNASISNVEGFKKVDFLLAHGSGDDNGISLLCTMIHRMLTRLQCTLLIRHICWICSQLHRFVGSVSGCSRIGTLLNYQAKAF